MTCTDPVYVVNGKHFRFNDNKWYIGHDEPSIKFISNKPGSGNTMSYLTKIPVDPQSVPDRVGSVTNYGQLSVAPWFGLPICDSLSFPQGPAHPTATRTTRSAIRRGRVGVHGATAVPAGLHPVR